MRVIRRLDVINNQAWLTDDNLGTDATAELASGTGYTAGDEVKVTGTAGGAATATYKIYEALQGTTGNDPTTDVGTVSPGIGTYWKETGSVNEWAMFNDVVQDQTVKATSLNVEITSGKIVTGVALINLVGSSLNVTVTDPTDGEVHNEDYNLTDNSGIDSWYDYFFEPVVRFADYAVLDLPPYKNAAIDITLTASGDAAIGALVPGQSLIIGRTLKGASLMLEDYSKATYVPALGRVIFEERDFSIGGDFDVLMPKELLPFVKNQLVSLRTDSTAWIADATDPGTIVFGYMRDLDILLSTDLDYMINLRIEGVT